MKTFSLLVLSLFCAINTFGKAAYHQKDRAIRTAEIIAIVDIQKVEPTKTKGEGSTYSEVAHANVERVLKGDLSKSVKLYGSANFICAQVKYTPGRHLVFLQHDKELLTGANWHLGVLPITGDSVQWFENDKSIDLKPVLLRTVVEEIEKVIENDWPIMAHVRHESRPGSGTKLKFACWQDGTVLFRKADDDRLLVGHIAHPAFWKMWRGLREAEFFSTPRESYQVPDADYETILIHLGSESAIHSWHGVLTRGFGGDIETDAEYRAFVEMWKKSTAAISEGTPPTSKPLFEVAKDGKFRGYDIETPHKTEWLNSRKWKEAATRN